jgi:hypothetical protein
LLIEYQDVFAKHDLNLGCLTTVKHKIDTKDATPVKQKMRRTPLGFQEHEQQHLTKMLNAGVIQPSTSAWASAPVLIRKKCGVWITALLMIGPQQIVIPPYNRRLLGYPPRDDLF